jgi:lipopolysaccharide transport system ATP-binding protein
VKVYSWGTLNQDISIWSGRVAGQVFWERRFDADSQITVDFSCECTLGADLYEVQAAVTQELDRYFGDQRTLHWRDEAAFFQVLVRHQEYFFGGVCDMRMRADAGD